MKGLLKVGLVLGVVAVGTAVVRKKYAPQVLEETKDKLKKIGKPQEVTVEVEDAEDLVADTYDALAEAGEEAYEAVAEVVESIDEAGDEWPDLSQIPDVQENEQA